MRKPESTAGGALFDLATADLELRHEEAYKSDGQLRALAIGTHAALMCAEAVPWRCHRSLIADALSARGAKIEHITSLARSTPHRLTPFALVDGPRVTYPTDAGGPLDERSVGCGG